MIECKWRNDLNKLKQVEEWLKDLGWSVLRITGVTSVAILISYSLNSFCRYVDRTLTPNEDVPIFVINLDNVKDRMSFLDAQLDNYSKFSAVDWREISISEDEQIYADNLPKRMTVATFVEDKSDVEKYVAESLRYPDTKLRLKKKYFRKRDIGRFFSHVALWNECYKKAYDRILVFEDDVVLKPFFRTKLRRFLGKIPKDFDIAFLGYRGEFCWKSKPLSRVGIHAYIVNLKRKNLRSFIRDFYNTLPIDFMIWLASENLKCSFNKKQVLALNEEFKSHDEFDTDVVDPKDIVKYKNEIKEFFENYYLR